MGGYAALPIFVFWLGLVFAPRDFAGPYSLTIQTLSGVLALASFAGIVSIIANRPPVTASRGILVTCGFTAVQLLAWWLSVRL